MAKVQLLFLPIKVTVSPEPSASFNAGDEVTLDTNVPGFVLYTTDGSLPIEGEFGTTKIDTPVTIEIATTTTLRFKAVDNRSGQEFNQTKTASLTYTVSRRNPAEVFRDNKHFFKRLDSSLVDHNFYVGGINDWVVPVSTTPYTYLFKNPETRDVRTRLLSNGIDALNVVPYPILVAGGTFEYTIPARSGDNDIEIQTEASISV